MRPRFVKKRETSSPSSASAAISSAEAAEDFLRMLFVEPSLGFGRFPEGNEVGVFAFTVVAYLEDQGVQATLYPANRAILFWEIAPLVEVIGPLEEFLCFFESDRPFRIRAELRALFPIESNAH